MNPVSPTLRRAAIADLGPLRELSIRTFRETYASYNTEEDMDQYLARHFSRAQMTAELNNPDCHFYIAFLEKTPVAYTKLNFGMAQTDLKEATGAEVERIYVEQAYHRQKIGNFLLAHAVDVFKQSGMHYAWLGVWERNEKAIRFYEQYGFRKAGTHVFTLGDDDQTDYIMRLELY